MTHVLIGRWKHILLQLQKGKFTRNMTQCVQGPFNYIDGLRSEPLNKTRTFTVIEPATGGVLCHVHETQQEDINIAIDSAKKAQQHWSQVDRFTKSSVLLRAADIIRKNVEDIAHLEVRDSGKPLREARSDVLGCAETFQFFGSLSATISDQCINGNGNFTTITREPLGVCVGIGAWNFPFQMASWKSAPALAAGNTMVFKPSELTPLTAVTLAEILSTAGLPNGCFNVVQGGAETGKLLCLHPDVSKVSFTGGAQTGVSVALACAPATKKVTLELGGKSPIIVFEDCDVEDAVKAALMANFLSQGQVCSNGTRIFVQRSAVNQFLDKFVAAVKRLQIGDPMSENTHVGATITKVHAERVLGFISRAKDAGARILCGGCRVILDHLGLCNGYYLSPCLLDMCTDDMEIVKEEVFGAVACILEFDTEEEAVQRSNSTRYGLSAGVFTRDLARAHRVAKQLKAGNVWINNYNVFPTGVPFGGAKKSGYGRENGLAAIDDYTQLKSTYVELLHVEKYF